MAEGSATRRAKAPGPVAGIDRWRGGWIVAEVADDELGLWVCSEIGPATERLVDHHAVMIDMPIALVEQGTRSAETEIRSALGRAARSVFTSPTRGAVRATTQAEATVLNRGNGGPGISAQAFGLFASIRELRAALEGPQHRHWWETHPETAFAEMNGGEPLASKKSALGVGQRLRLVRDRFPAIDNALLSAPSKVPIDDVLDAVAAVWSAQRFALGQARRYGPAGRDDEGFATGILI